MRCHFSEMSELSKFLLVIQHYCLLVLKEFPIVTFNVNGTHHIIHILINVLSKNVLQSQCGQAYLNFNELIINLVIVFFLYSLMEHAYIMNKIYVPEYAGWILILSMLKEGFMKFSVKDKQAFEKGLCGCYTSSWTSTVSRQQKWVMTSWYHVISGWHSLLLEIDFSCITGHHFQMGLNQFGNEIKCLSSGSYWDCLRILTLFHMHLLQVIQIKYIYLKFVIKDMWSHVISEVFKQDNIK